MENASGEGEQECWFEGGCIELSDKESGSWRDCCQSGVNLATPVCGDKSRSKLELISVLSIAPTIALKIKTFSFDDKAYY